MICRQSFTIYGRVFAIYKYIIYLLTKKAELFLFRLRVFFLIYKTGQGLKIVHSFPMISAGIREDEGSLCFYFSPSASTPCS